MKERAFTLVEVVVVFSIIFLLAALLQPAFVNAMEAAKIGVSKSNLRLIGQATAMYRTQCDGDGIFGNAWRMGLPCDPQPDHLDILNDLTPPRNDHPSAMKIGSSYKQIFGVGGLYGNQWAPYALSAESSSVIFVDPFFNPTDVDLVFTQHYPTRLIALRIDTSVFTRRKRGEWDSPKFWHDHYNSTIGK